MNPLRSLLNLVRRKKQPIDVGDVYCYRDELFPEDKEAIKHRVLKVNDKGVKFTMVGHPEYPRQLERKTFLQIYRKANQ